MITNALNVQKRKEIIASLFWTAPHIVRKFQDGPTEMTHYFDIIGYILTFKINGFSLKKNSFLFNKIFVLTIAVTRKKQGFGLTAFI